MGGNNSKQTVTADRDLATHNDTARDVVDTRPQAVQMDPTRPPPQLGPGEPRIIGDFQVQKVLGQGAFGKVYLGLRDGREYALKLIPVGNPNVLKLAMLEVHALRSLHHPNIVSMPVDPFTVDAGTVCIVMDYCNAGTLADYVAGRQNPIELVLKWFLSLLDTLADLHAQNAIHRDLKPENILLHRTGAGMGTEGELVLKITDFGLTKILEGTVGAQTKVGTPLFAAPEVLLTNNRYDNRCDMFSLGVLLIQSVLGLTDLDFLRLTRNYPLAYYCQDGNRPMMHFLRTNVPAQLHGMLLRMLCPVEERATAAQLRTDPFVVCWSSIAALDPQLPALQGANEVDACICALQAVDARLVRYALNCLLARPLPEPALVAFDAHNGTHWLARALSRQLELIYSAGACSTASDDELAWRGASLLKQLLERNSTFVQGTESSQALVAVASRCASWQLAPLSVVCGILSACLTSGQPAVSKQIWADPLLQRMLKCGASDESLVALRLFIEVAPAAASTSDELRLLLKYVPRNRVDVRLMLLHNVPLRLRPKFADTALSELCLMLPDGLRTPVLLKMLVETMHKYTFNYAQAAQAATAYGCCLLRVGPRQRDAHWTCTLSDGKRVCISCAVALYSGHEAGYRTEKELLCEAVNPSAAAAPRLSECARSDPTWKSKSTSGFGLRMMTADGMAKICGPHTAEHLSDSPASLSVFHSNAPLYTPTVTGAEDATVAYFEALLVRAGPRSVFKIGFGSPSQAAAVVAYTSTGACLVGSSRTIGGPEYSIGDCVGCGVTARGVVFFTLNGQLVRVVRQLPAIQYYDAVIEMSGAGSLLHVNFGKYEFFYHFDLPMLLEPPPVELARQTLVASNALEGLTKARSILDDETRTLCNRLISCCKSK